MTYYSLTLSWDDGRGWRRFIHESIRVLIRQMNADKREHPDAIGTIVGFRIKR